jgi:nickel/cobalt exporter
MVTAGHTGAVLVVGLLISGGTALAGERLLGWLGIASGLIVAAVGAAMLLRRGPARHHHHDHHHPHDHDHDHDHDRHHVHGHDHEDGHGHDHETGPGHEDGHGHEHDHEDGHDHRAGRRWGLAGLGLAGGLVPSPSALVVLLAAIGIGRAAFGVLLVVLYGIGMAATLTAAGLVLLAARRRLADRLERVSARLAPVLPRASAALVLAVGLAMATRAAVVL